MRYLSFVLLFIFSGYASSQVGFTNTYGAFGLYNESKDIDVDTSGNVYLCGSSGGLGAQNGDILIVKTDSSGNQLWAKVYGGVNSEYGTSIALFADSGFVAAGYTNSGENNDYNVYIFRADNDGEVLWDTTIGSNTWDEAADIITLRDGGFAIVVNEWGATGEEKSLACYKYNSGNILEWIYRPVSSTFSEANAILELSDSSLFIGGAGVQSIGLEDMLLIKLNYDGAEQWTRYYGGEQSEWIAGLALSNDDRIGVAGNRLLDGENSSPQLLSLDTNGDILHQFFDPNFAEATSVSYSPFTNSYFFSWNYINSNGTPKASIFNFTNDFVFRCNAVVTVDPFQEQHGTRTAMGVNGQMHLTGNIIGTGPGITSLFSFKCADFCQNNQSLQVNIEESDNEFSALLYPNPASDIAYLKLPSDEKIEQVTLIDVAGRVSAIPFNSSGDVIKVDLGNKANGFYYLKVLFIKDGVQNLSFPIPLIISK